MSSQSQPSPQTFADTSEGPKASQTQSDPSIVPYNPDLRSTASLALSLPSSTLAQLSPNYTAGQPFETLEHYHERLKGILGKLKPGTLGLVETVIKRLPHEERTGPLRSTSSDPAVSTSAVQRLGIRTRMETKPEVSQHNNGEYAFRDSLGILGIKC